MAFLFRRKHNVRKFISAADINTLDELITKKNEKEICNSVVRKT